MVGFQSCLLPSSCLALKMTSCAPRTLADALKREQRQTHAENITCYCPEVAKPLAGRLGRALGCRGQSGGRANRIHPHPEGLVFLSRPRVGMTKMCYHRASRNSFFPCIVSRCNWIQEEKEHEAVKKQKAMHETAPAREHVDGPGPLGATLRPPPGRASHGTRFARVCRGPRGRARRGGRRPALAAVTPVRLQDKLDSGAQTLCSGPGRAPEWRYRGQF